MVVILAHALKMILWYSGSLTIFGYIFIQGYLLSEGCDAAAKVFLDTNPNLTECKQRVERGKRVTHANTLLLGHNLIEVLNIVCSVHSCIKLYVENQKRHDSEVDSLSQLFEQLRSIVLPESITNLSGGLSSRSVSTVNQPHSCSQEYQTELQEDANSQVSESAPSTHFFNSPVRQQPERRESLAESYKTLVEECGVGIDLSLSPEKQISRLVVTPEKPSHDKPTSESEVLACQDVETSSQPTMAASTGVPGATSQVTYCSSVAGASTVSSVHQTIVTTVPHSVIPTTPIRHEPHSSQVLISNPNPINLATSYPSTSFTVPANSVLLPVMTTGVHPVTVPFQPPTSSSISTLPDPPIIILSNNKNQPATSYNAPDQSSSYFGALPSAASTPYARPTAFAPEDTACIVYPPVDLYSSARSKKRKPAPFKERKQSKLAPKPMKNPLQVIHVKLLPQIEEYSENESDMQDDINHQDNDLELAKALPDLNCDHEKNTEALPAVEKDVNHEIETNNAKHDSGNEEQTVTLKERNLEEKKLTEKTPEESSNIRENIDKEVKTPKPYTFKKRLSRSTPRRNNHVRALSFNTPNKPINNRRANTSPKMPIVKFSPRSSKLNSVKRSSLFKSPPSILKQTKLPNINESEDETIEGIIDENKTEFVKKSPILKLPIATRSPTPKLSNAWKEVNDVILPEKPVWDEKIRSFICGDFIDPAPPPKKETKKKPPIKTNLPKKTIEINLPKTTIQTNVPKKHPKQKEEPNLRRSRRLLKTSEESKNGSISLKEKSDGNESLQEVVKTDCKAGPSKALKKTKKLYVKNKKSLKPTSNRKITVKDSNLSSNESTVEHSSPEKSLNELAFDKTIDSDNHDKEISDKNTNILLEDLVVSSNSCFPSVNEDSGSVNKNSKNENQFTSALSRPSATVEFKESNDATPGENSSAKFLLPSVPVLETPMKDAQLISSNVVGLNTPLLNTIRRETSILEEDLLLTPSLPPTPQVNSPRNIAITPCKPCVVVIAEAEVSNPIVKNPQPNFPEEKQVTNISCVIKTNIVSGSNDKTFSVTSHNNTEISSTNLLGSGKYELLETQEMSHNFKEKDITKESIVSSSSDSSENGASAIAVYGSSPKSEVSVTEVKNERCIFKKQGIYSSDSDDNKMDSKKTNVHPVSNLSKLASMLIKNEKKSLDKKLKNKKGKNNTKPKTQKKNKCKTVKVTPEKVRQQLQLDLLKRERLMIFGDKFSSSSSDSETDANVFEEKLSKPVKLSKPKQTNKILNTHKDSKIFINSDSSSDNVNESINNDRLDKSLGLDSACDVNLHHINNNTSTKKPDVSKFTSSFPEKDKNNGHLKETEESEVGAKKTTPSISGEKGRIGLGNKNAGTNVNSSVILNSNTLKDVISLRKNTHSNRINDVNDISDTDNESCSEVGIPRPPTPLSFKGSQSSKTPLVQPTVTVTENGKNEFYMSIVSSSTSKNNSCLYLEKFDPQYTTSYEVDDGKMCNISFSNTFNHILLPLCSLTNIKPNSNSENKIASKDSAKRRVKLTPIVDSNYEKKLKVNYDVDCEGNVTTYKVSKKGSELINVKELPKINVTNTSQNIEDKDKKTESQTHIFSSPTQIKMKVDSFNDITKQGNSQCETKIIEQREQQHSKKKYSKHNLSWRCSKSDHGDSRENKIDREADHSHESIRSIRDERSLKSRSPPGRKDRYGYRRSSPYRRIYRRMDERIYLERRSSSSTSRRHYSDRRNYSSYHNRSRDSPRSKTSRQEYHKSSGSSVDVRLSKHLDEKSPLKKRIKYTDVDKVEDKDDWLTNIEVDPRADKVLTYSDVEKSDSSSKDASSLMDFAVMEKTSTKRFTPSSDEKTHPSSSTPILLTQQSTTTSKRKASMDEETKDSTSQENKRLKLGEVDMREAKSVLKHKLVDMLNVLHPDTSNEGT